MLLWLVLLFGCTSSTPHPPFPRISHVIKEAIDVVTIRFYYCFYITTDGDHNTAPRQDLANAS